jgi:hypothetical protein
MTRLTIATTKTEVARTPWRRVLVAVLVLAGAFFVATYFVKKPEARSVDEAVAAVESHLRAPPVSSLPDELGSFQRLTGRGYDHAAWNVGAPHLVARRTGHFANREILILTYVWLPDGWPSVGRRWLARRARGRG